MSSKDELNNVYRKIKDLRDELITHSHLYYVKNTPRISDSEYDALFRQLEQLEHDYPEFISDGSPTQRVGASVSSGFEKITHVIKMLSLTNCFTEKEFVTFHNRIKKAFPDWNEVYMCEPKLDGLSCDLRYDYGVLKTGATRGDGIIGEDITQNIQEVYGIPYTLSTPSKGFIPEQLHIRGEVVMERSSFDRLNKERTNKFVSPRNAASGSLRQLDPNEVRRRGLSGYMYHLASATDLDIESTLISHLPTQTDILNYLTELGFKVASTVKLCNGVKEVMDYYNSIIKHRKEFDYDIDGVVVKVNDILYQRKLGADNRTPRWAIAFKLPATQRTSRINDIVLQVGKQGK